MSARPLSVSRGNDRFAARRRVRRRRIFIASCVLFTILVIGIIYEIHQPFLCISKVQIFGADQSVADIALRRMQGSYFWVIPRDSTFFYPEGGIREDILTAHPDFAAVSLFRDGFDGLSIRIDSRAPVGKWCGLTQTEGVDEYCYFYDASGLVFGAVDDSTTKPINNFKLYAPLEGKTEEPLNSTIAKADTLPSVFDFARELTTFGATVMRVVIHDGEVDDYLSSGTRVTYVLGSDQNAFTALVSAKQNFDLSDGSIEYVDLRFDGKVYLKRKSDTVAE